MLRNKRFITFLIAGFLLVGSALAQTSSVNLVSRYLLKSEEAMDAGELDEAYKNINNALKLSKTSDSEIIPTNVLVSARMIYRAKVRRLQEKYTAAELIDIKTYLEEFPEVGTAEITKLIRQIESDAAAREAQKAQRSQEALAENLKESALSATNAISEMREESRKNSERFSQQSDAIRESLELTRTQVAQTQDGFRHIFILIVIIVVVILLIVLLIVVIVRVAAKTSQQQQARYAEAFKLLAANQTQTNKLMIGGIAGLYGDSGLRLAGSSSTWNQTSLPPPEETPEEKEELRRLAAKCEDLGAKVDQVTGRKNNSKNVSELVYKIALHLGVSQHDALIYFCAGMIYDSGFLGIDPEILQAETLTEAQRNELNRHVDLADGFLQFVPKRYWETFIAAAHLHHENMDGSGPEGLEGKDIPDIARIIRVVDSYNALTSRRSFREGTDKEAAVSLLEERKEIYDQEVIAALREII